LVGEPRYALVQSLQVGDDEAEAWEQLGRILFHLGPITNHDPKGRIDIEPIAIVDLFLALSRTKTQTIGLSTLVDTELTLEGVARPMGIATSLAMQEGGVVQVASYQELRLVNP
jgi:hypothetical protein